MMSALSAPGAVGKESSAGELVVSGSITKPYRMRSRIVAADTALDADAVDAKRRTRSSSTFFVANSPEHICQFRSTRV